MGSGTRFVDKDKKICALHAVVPSSATPKWVNLKGYNHVQAIISFLNATTVTGSAITLQQATAVAGTGAKALAFPLVWVNTDDSASSALVQTAVVSNTFTVSNVNSKSGYYMVEVDADDLDMKNGFNCFQVAAANATAQTLEIWYVLGNVPRYGGESTGGFQDPLVN